MAVTGHVDEISRKTIAGWAADNEDWGRGVEIAVFVNGKLTSRFPAVQLREGLKASLGAGATGKYGFEFNFDPGLSILDEHKIEVKAVGASQPLPNGAKVLKPAPKLKNPLTPIMVTSSGRSGTTLLMQWLSKHPELVMNQLYPYEMKLASYYAAAFRVLTADTDRINSTHPDTMFGEKFRHLIGSNPYTRLGFHGVTTGRRALERFFEETVPTAYAEAFRNLIQEYYNVLKEDQNKPLARYFVEKTALDEAARKALRLFFGNVREIVLVRDPRDLLCSAKAFWKASTEQAERLVVHSSRRLEEISLHAGADTLVVKYEDLVATPSEAMQRVADFVGLSRIKLSDAETDKNLFGIHGTSSSPSSSIGRWRKDLTRQEVEYCEQHLSSFMNLFGYVRETTEAGRDSIASAAST